MSKCEKCAADRNNCLKCADNPIYANFPRVSYYSPYKPTCPYGYTDCVGDPAYILHINPDWYKILYGNKTPEEASKEQCLKSYEKNKNYCDSYDDEDK